jgi:tetratricopeptide (TPR) repeat protein
MSARFILIQIDSCPDAMDITETPKSPSPVEQEVRRIHGLCKAQRFAEALAAAELLLGKVPENRDVLYLMAKSQRHLRQIPQALQTLDRLQQHHPRFSRLYEERGNCQVARKEARQAIDAFLIGVNINPALLKSWSMLESLYRMVGEDDNVATSAAHVATLKRLPPDIVTATGLFSDGDLALAESIIRAYLLRHGDHVEAMRLLARIGLEHQVWDDAETLLEAALKLAPDYRAARYDYARALLERHKYSRAREELQQLLSLEPGNRQYRTLFATAIVGLGEHDRAAVLYRQLLSEAPDSPDIRMSLAHSLKTLGRRDDAIREYRAIAAAHPGYGDAYWSLANLKTYRFSASEIHRMGSEEASPTTKLVDRYHLCFALGKAFEDASEYERSFRYYDKGNSLKRSEGRYRPEYIERNTALQIEVCTQEFFEARAGVGAKSPEPIFIVGLPRSGSTLIEQILASHSCVEGTQELADIPRIVLELQGVNPDLNDPKYPAALTGMKAEDFEQLGHKYLRDTKIYRTEKPRFIDKMPNNFRHVGLLHLLLPNAKIIDARREPMACCFSNFKQLFAAGQEFTYSFEDIARYYRTYLELMRHWDAVLPGKILRVEHSAVVGDLAGSVRRILEYCELDFEAACEEFHKNERSVRTASSEQVRQPIFRGGLDQWSHYEPWLGPLKSTLADAVWRYQE